MLINNETLATNNNILPSCQLWLGRGNNYN